MSVQKNPAAIDEYIRVRVAMIAAEKISVGTPPDRAVAEALAEIRRKCDVRFEGDVAASLGVKSR